MIHLDLSDQEAVVLRDVLQQQHTTLLMEIANTDAREYRDALQQRETIVRRITEQLEGPQLNG
jgi:hypothetical protein